MKKVLIISGLLLLSLMKLNAQFTTNNIVLYSVKEENGLSDDHVQCVLKDKKGFVWVGTSDGLNLLDGSSIRIFRHRQNDSSTIISSNILSLAEDDFGNIWIGTDVGLSCFQRKQSRFLSFVPAKSPYGNSSFINTLYVESQQKIWCSTDGGLVLFNSTDNSFHSIYNFSFQKNATSFCNKLTHLIKDKEENKFWLSTADGLWSFDLKNFHYKEEISPENDADYQALFTYVYESDDKKIWVGSWGNGLEQLDRTTRKVIHYFSLPHHPGIVKCISEAQEPGGKNILWLDGSLFAFDPSNSHFFNYSYSSQNKEANDFFPCYKSSDGWIWLASSSGLYIYNPERQFFQYHLFAKNFTNQGIALAEWNQSILIGAGQTH